MAGNKTATASQDLPRALPLLVVWRLLFFLIIITKHIMISSYHLPDCRYDISLLFLRYLLVVFSLKMESQKLYSIKRSSTGHLPLMMGLSARGKSHSTAHPTETRSSSQIRGAHCMDRDLTLTASTTAVHRLPTTFCFCELLLRFGVSPKDRPFR